MAASGLAVRPEVGVGTSGSFPDWPFDALVADIGTAKSFHVVRGSGRPLVLHGLFRSSLDFEAVIPALSHSFRVITIDRRGQWHRPRPNAADALRQQAERKDPGAGGVGRRPG